MRSAPLQILFDIRQPGLNPPQPTRNAFNRLFQLFLLSASIEEIEDPNWHTASGALNEELLVAAALRLNLVDLECMSVAFDACGPCHFETPFGCGNR
jgi:hypothetical protein